MVNYNHFVTFNSLLSPENKNDLRKELNTDVTGGYKLLFDRVYFEKEEDMSWFLLKWS